MSIKRIFPWLLAGFISLAGIIQYIYLLPEVNINEALLIESMAGVIFVILLPTLFSFLAAFILTKQSGNLVGWLMMVTAVAAVVPSNYVQSLTVADTLTPRLWLLLWLENWVWLLFGIAPLLIPLNFPNGHPPSSRWKWVNGLALGVILFAAVSSAFAVKIGPSSGEWVVGNPLGFIPISNTTFNLVGIISNIATLIVAGASIASLFFRFRRAKPIERQQIKWLLFAGAILILSFLWVLITWEEPPTLILPILMGGISLLLIPLAITIAILRYRLYDIDLIIRRTLQYTILTGLLALIYFGSVLLLQNLFVLLIGEQSPVVTVISTLVIAALFNPLRVRIQDFIDKRFYRKKYDAEQALANFATIARDEVDLNSLSASIITVVTETMQPEKLSLWLRRER